MTQCRLNIQKKWARRSKIGDPDGINGIRIPGKISVAAFYIIKNGIWFAKRQITTLARKGEVVTVKLFREGSPFHINMARPLRFRVKWNTRHQI